MAVSLTQDDLLAIKTIVEDAIEDSKQDTAAGFSEVHELIGDLSDEIGAIKADFIIVKDEIGNVKGQVGDVREDLGAIKDAVMRMEGIQRAEVERVDEHGRQLSAINRNLMAT